MAPGEMASKPKSTALACMLSKRNKGTVYAVYVIEVARALPLDADLSPKASEGEQVLAEAEKLAASLDSQVTGELLQARDTGHAIVDEAIERAVDGIIVGIDNREVGEFQTGATSRYILRNAPCQVIICRSAAGSGGP